MAKVNAFITYCLIGLIRLYRLVISGFFGYCCRFEPSCSAYAMEAIKTCGWLKGSGMAAKRILRCHPWHPGGFDPVHEKLKNG